MFIRSLLKSSSISTPTSLVVMGMVPVPLRLKLTIRDGPQQGEKVYLVLEQVLVIDRLPVPIHVSIKRLRSMTETPEQQQIIDSLNQGDLEFASNSVPESYRNHPYWLESSTIFIGSFGKNAAAIDASRWDHLESASAGSKDQISVIKCAVCDITTGLMKCGACKNIYYCGKVHQKCHWRVHKSSCVQAVHS